jgi:hypothetical protein
MKKNKSSFIEHIENLYQMEMENEAYVDESKTVTFNFPATDACMLAAIAKRFGKSSAAFGGELFAEHVRELFIALSPADRRLCAAEADSECFKFLESKGSNHFQHSAAHWARYADICDRVEAEDSINKGRDFEREAMASALAENGTPEQQQVFAAHISNGEAK